MISEQPGAPHDRDADAEWAWVAGAYREVPAASPEAITRAVGVATTATGHQRHAPFWWVLGAAAAIGLVLLGRSLAESRRAVAPEGLSESPVARADVPPPRREPAAAGPAPAPADPPSANPSSEEMASVPAERERIPAPPPASPSPVSPTSEPQPAPLAMLRDTLAVPIDPTGIAPAPVRIAGLSGVQLERLRAALGEESLRVLAALVHRATADGIPAAPLLDRAMAGLAHAAPPSVILATVERRASALRQARGPLGSDATGDELTAGADALEAGAAAPELAQVRRLFPRGRATAALLMLAGLVADGVPAPAAAEALARSVDAGASDATLLALRNGVAADVARGMPPLTALRARLASLDDATSLEQRVPSPDPVLRRPPADLPHGP